MHPWPSKRTHRSRSVVLVGLLCIFLLLFGATIQAVHMHPDGATHSDCALCATAHVVLATVACLTLTRFFSTFAPFVAHRKDTLPRFDIAYALFNRPPPDQAALS